MNEETQKHLDYWNEECGMCMKCKEWTSVLLPCCGVSVWYEGDTMSGEDLIAEVCECEGKGTCEACKYVEKL